VIYPADFEKKIGFDKIRELMRQECLCSLGEGYVDRIEFLNDIDRIRELINQTWEFRNILTEDPSFPSQDYYDMLPELERIETEGTYLDKDTLPFLLSSLKTIKGCISFFKGQGSSRYPSLSLLIHDLTLPVVIIERIETIIDEKGKIRDTASPSLKKIRTDMTALRGLIDKKMGLMLRHARQEGWIRDDISVTIRNGRAVLPVPAMHKRRIKGFIHDESATGQTVYIEPTEVFDQNNRLREIELSERREIIKILTDLTNFLRPHVAGLIKAYEFLGRIDFIRAKARLALLIDARKPGIQPGCSFNWIDAVHPLLYLSHAPQKKPVVPLSVYLNEKQRILIISGPNAGGKSIGLKTIGLLQYMLQTGLLVPLNEQSAMGLFDQIFLDIGDEQSIENDLSTYSSHLLNVKYFLNHVDRRSLFLIDEFGSGTEPQLGGAIAEAALERFAEVKAFGVVTTHYANLKLLEGKVEGIFNGAMLFDTRIMQPLYRLSTGHPGSSYAFEIANKIGFPKEILDSAVKKTGKTQLDFDRQLQQLEIEKEEVSKKHAQFRVADDFLAEVTHKYEKLLQDLQDSRQKILEEAREEARQIIESSNRLIEKTIKEIREKQAAREETKNLREEIKAFSKTLQPDEKESVPVSASQKELHKKKETAKATPPHTLKKGDLVNISGQHVPGEVIDVSGEEATIAVGHVTIKAHVDKLEKLNPEIARIITPTPVKTTGNIMEEIHHRMANFKLTIDVRGKCVAEALSEIRTYLDDAVMLSIPEIAILHGKGDGVLRENIREYLKTVPQIKHYGDEHIERGGDGITLVRFV